MVELLFGLIRLPFAIIGAVASGLFWLVGAAFSVVGAVFGPIMTVLWQGALVGLVILVVWGLLKASERRRGRTLSRGG